MAHVVMVSHEPMFSDAPEASEKLLADAVAQYAVEVDAPAFRSLGGKQNWFNRPVTCTPSARPVPAGLLACVRRSWEHTAL